MQEFEKLFSEKINAVLGSIDPAHDIGHVLRVVKAAKELSIIEGAKFEIVVPAAYLHDVVNLPKNHPERSSASKLAAQEALKFLDSIHYPREYFPEIAHAIIAHSFSGGVAPTTLEAKILQDADRLDALGAVGLARLFAVSAQLKRPFYDLDDPFALERTLNDKKNAIDHIEVKLRQLPHQMHTASAKEKAGQRLGFIEVFLEQLKNEISTY